METKRSHSNQGDCTLDSVLTVPLNKGVTVPELFRVRKSHESNWTVTAALLALWRYNSSAHEHYINNSDHKLRVSE